MLDFTGLIIVLAGIVTLYKANIDRANLLSTERGRMATVRVQTIAMWQLYEIWIGSALILGIMLCTVVRVMTKAPRYTGIGWLLLLAFVCQFVWFRRHLRFLVRQTRDYWADKAPPRQVQL